MVQTVEGWPWDKRSDVSQERRAQHDRRQQGWTQRLHGRRWPRAGRRCSGGGTETERKRNEEGKENLLQENGNQMIQAPGVQANMGYDRHIGSPPAAVWGCEGHSGEQTRTVPSLGVGPVLAASIGLCPASCEHPSIDHNMIVSFSSCILLPFFPFPKNVSAMRVLTKLDT